MLWQEGRDGPKDKLPALCGNLQQQREMNEKKMINRMLAHDQFDYKNPKPQEHIHEVAT